MAGHSSLVSQAAISYQDDMGSLKIDIRLSMIPGGSQLIETVDSMD